MSNNGTFSTAVPVDGQKKLPPKEHTLLRIISSECDRLETTTSRYSLAKLSKSLWRKNNKKDSRITINAFAQELKTFGFSIFSRHLVKPNYTQLSVHKVCDASYPDLDVIACFIYVLLLSSTIQKQNTSSRQHCLAGVLSIRQENQQKG